MMDRRFFLTGLVAAPAIVPINRLMKLPRVPLIRPLPSFDQGQLYFELQRIHTAMREAMEYRIADTLRVPAQVLKIASGSADVGFTDPISQCFRFNRVALMRDGNELFYVNDERHLITGDSLRLKIEL